MASTPDRMRALQFSKFGGGAAALESVYASHSLLLLNGGSLAEYVVSPLKYTIKRPENVSALDGASFGIAGQSALQSVRDSGGIKLDGSCVDKNVLITAASGGVGTYAVQLAKLGGAHVTATCGARNVDLVKSLGADEVLDYKTPEGATLQSPSGRKYDVVIHCAESQHCSTFKPQLARTARVIDLSPRAKTFLTIGVQLLTFSSQKFVPFLMTANGNDLA
uniref:Alcohol dehydrogenase-like C-terminal domain-containing protein n=1 Tax=Physcomitrium patens TaxID=3218 RepID=A0A7I4DLI2_PHYPA